MKAVLFIVAALTIALPSLAAEPADAHWPQWRGPLATGASPAATPPLTWSEKEGIKWRVKLPGRGDSTPVVWSDRIFVTSAIRTDRVGQPPAHSDGKAPTTVPSAMAKIYAQPQNVHQFVVFCIDRNTGKTLWQKTAIEAVPHEPHHRDHGYASASPIVDGQRVIAFFGSRGLYCFDLEGNLKWQKDLGLMRVKMNFGEGASPALFGKTLVVNWDHEGDDFVATFDVETGKELWRTPRDEDSSWATPLIVTHDGKQQVIIPATRKIRSYDLATGKQLWECKGMTINVIPSPVYESGVVYAISGFRGASLMAIKLGREGDLFGTDAIAWEYHKNTPYVPSPALSDGRLYFFNVNKAVLTCMDIRTGKPCYAAKEVEGLDGVYASPIAAAGRVYLVGRNGATVVIKDAEQFEILATNKLEDSFTASPAAAGKQLFLRGGKNLYCLE